MIVLYSVILLLSLSLALGVMIAIFAKVFEVKTDPRIALVNSVLPAFNCGSCGYPGCINYAAAIIMNHENTGKCTPGGPKTAQKIKEILALKETTGPAKV